MKKTNYFTSKTLASVVALAILAVASVSQAETVAQVVTVLKVEGLARCSSDNKNWKAVKVGDILKPGSVIQTAEHSSVDISLGDKPNAITSKTSVSSANTANSSSFAPEGSDSSKGNVIHVYESSVLAIDKLSMDRTGVDEVGDTQLDLRAGKILGNVKKLSSASHYEVKIPNGVAGIRGTAYMITSSGQVYVVQGTVLISYVTPSGTVVTKSVAAGQSFDPYYDPSTGKDGSTPGAGNLTTIPPSVLALLTKQIANLPSGPTTYATAPSSGPPTLIHVSPTN